MDARPGVGRNYFLAKEAVQRFMNYFFCGTDDFLVQQAVQEEVNRFAQRQPEGNTRRFDFSDSKQWGAWSDQIKTISFFKEPRLFLMREGFFNSAAAEMILRSLDQSVSLTDTFLIYQAQTAEELKKKHSALFAFLSSRFAVKIFDVLKGKALEKWAKKESEKNNLMIAPALLESLLVRTNFSAARAYQELAKLAAYKKILPGPITEEDLNQLVGQTMISSNFALAEAVVKSNRPQAIALLHHLLSQAEDPLAILGLLIFQFRSLLWIKSLLKEGVSYARLANLTKLHPFVVKKSYEQAGQFGLSQLTHCYRQLVTAEKEIKIGQGDLFLTVFNLLNSSAGG